MGWSPPKVLSSSLKEHLGSSTNSKKRSMAMLRVIYPTIIICRAKSTANHAARNFSEKQLKILATVAWHSLQHLCSQWSEISMKPTNIRLNGPSDHPLHEAWLEFGLHNLAEHHYNLVNPIVRVFIWKIFNLKAQIIPMIASALLAQNPKNRYELCALAVHMTRHFRTLLSIS